MSVVSRLCGKMEPNDQSLNGCVEALSILLKHEDNHVADGALRCFASLADRYYLVESYLTSYSHLHSYYTHTTLILHSYYTYTHTAPHIQ
jgi:hypothetical protein